MHYFIFWVSNFTWDFTFLEYIHGGELDKGCKKNHTSFLVHIRIVISGRWISCSGWCKIRYFTKGIQKQYKESRPFALPADLSQSSLKESEWVNGIFPRRKKRPNLIDAYNHLNIFL